MTLFLACLIGLSAIAISEGLRAFVIAFCLASYFCFGLFYFAEKKHLGRDMFLMKWCVTRFQVGRLTEDDVYGNAMALTGLLFVVGLALLGLIDSQIL